MNTKKCKKNNIEVLDDAMREYLQQNVTNNKQDDYIEILLGYSNKYSSKEYNTPKTKIVFRKDNKMYINSTSNDSNEVIYNHEWAKLLILKNKDDSEQAMRTAFELTYGHELAHIDSNPLVESQKPIFVFIKLLAFILLVLFIAFKDSIIIKIILFLLLATVAVIIYMYMNYITSKSDKYHFFSWVNEVYADYCGIKKVFKGDVCCGITGLTFKKDYKDPDDSYFIHPPWEKRIQYVKEMKFDGDLIDKIAQDLEFKNERFISKVKNKYKTTIELTYPK